MRTAFAAAALAALALLPASAAAKEISKVEVCGAGGCAAVTGGPRALENAAAPGYGSEAPPHGRFYVVRATVSTTPGEGGDEFRFRTIWVPRADLLRIGEGREAQWTIVPDATRFVLRRTVRGLRPYPAARLPRTVAPVPTPRVDEGYTVTPGAVRSVAAATGGGAPWGWIAAGVAAAVAAAALVLVLRRRQASSNTSVAFTPR